MCVCVLDVGCADDRVGGVRWPLVWVGVVAYAGCVWLFVCVFCGGIGVRGVGS